MTVTSWTAYFAADNPTNLTDEQLQAFIAAFPADAGAAVGVGGGITATFTVEAATFTDAISVSQCLFNTALAKADVNRFDVARGEVVRTDIADAELEEPNTPDLAGMSEVSGLLGVSKQRVDQLRARADFPHPLADLASGPVWDRKQLAHFQANWSRRPGRPRKAAAAPQPETVAVR